MSYTVGKLAAAAGVGVETIRFYERRGLVDQPERRASGYRVYTDDALRRIQFIRRAQTLGFTLSEIGELIALETDASASCGPVRERAADKIAAVERKIADLTRMKLALGDLLDRCDGTTPIRECAIIDCLEHDSPASLATIAGAGPESGVRAGERGPRPDRAQCP